MDDLWQQPILSLIQFNVLFAHDQECHFVQNRLFNINCKGECTNLFVFFAFSIRGKNEIHITLTRMNRSIKSTPEMQVLIIAFDVIASRAHVAKFSF